MWERPPRTQPLRAHLHPQGTTAPSPVTAALAISEVFDAARHAWPTVHARSVSRHRSDQTLGYALGIDPASEEMRS